LKYDDLKALYKCSSEKLNNKIKAMKDAGILIRENDGYRISSNFIKKGGKN
jgi:predicted transcriptional regulator